MNRLRTLAYQIVFNGLSVLFVLLAPAVALGGERAMIGYAHRWARFHRWCARALLGITTRIEGAPLAGPALYAAKHQSMFETIELILLLDGPAPVLKRELMRIPIWGWATRVYGAIVVDRTASAKALRALTREAEAAKAAGRSVLLFPEGTRVAPGEQPPLQAGFAGLYRALALPVAPIALDAGRVWPRHGPKRPGVVTIRFGAPIPPGLPRREIEARTHAAINALDGPASS